MFTNLGDNTWMNCAHQHMNVVVLYMLEISQNLLISREIFELKQTLKINTTVINNITTF